MPRPILSIKWAVVMVHSVQQAAVILFSLHCAPM